MGACQELAWDIGYTVARKPGKSKVKRGCKEGEHKLKPAREKREISVK